MVRKAKGAAAAAAAVAAALQAGSSPCSSPGHSSMGPIQKISRSIGAASTRPGLQSSAMQAWQHQPTDTTLTIHISLHLARLWSWPDPDHSARHYKPGQSPSSYHPHHSDPHTHAPSRFANATRSPPPHPTPYHTTHPTFHHIARTWPGSGRGLILTIRPATTSLASLNPHHPHPHPDPHTHTCTASTCRPRAAHPHHYLCN
jgi:hypothetical protein